MATNRFSSWNCYAANRSAGCSRASKCSRRSARRSSRRKFSPRSPRRTARASFIATSSPTTFFLLADAAVPDTVKVLDFGIAKLAVEGQAKLTGTGAMLGTPAFMAPEQARGEADVDARADLYAVGATMYQALSGKLPYEAPSIPALLFAIVEKAPPPLRELRPDLPAELVAVVERAMSKDRNARFPDADAMRRALAPWSGLPATLPPPTSATAATIASGSVPLHEQATPIVVHHTPVSAKPATLATPPPEPRPASGATRVMVFVAVLCAIAGLTAVSILKVTRSSSEKTSSTAPAISSALPPMPSFAINVPTPTGTVDVSALVASATNINVQAPPFVAPRASVAVVSDPTSTPPPAPTEGKRYSGAHARFSSSDYSNCPKCDWEHYGQAVRDREASVTACFKASVHEPPHHETPYYEVSVSATGAITGVHSIADGAPNLDRCIRTVLTSIALQKNGGDAGSFKISFDAACKPGMENIPGSCD